MASLSSAMRLQQAISRLKEKEEEQTKNLMTTIEGLTRSLSPAGIIRSAIIDIAEDPAMRAGFVDAAAGIGAGWLGKKLITGNAKNIFSKAFGSVLQFFISGFVSSKMHQVRKKASTG